MSPEQKLAIRNNKTKTADPEKFAQALRAHQKVQFRSQTFIADVAHLESKNSHRETKITYFWKLNGKWQDFAFFCSKSIADIIADFQYEFSQLKTA